MDQICLVLPSFPGRHRLLAISSASSMGHVTDYDASERRIEMTKEVWFIVPRSRPATCSPPTQSEDFNKALAMFSQSRDEFDMWFTKRLAEVTGGDLNDSPEMSLPELVSSYERSQGDSECEPCQRGEGVMRRVEDLEGSGWPPYYSGIVAGSTVVYSTACPLVARAFVVVVTP